MTPIPTPQDVTSVVNTYKSGDRFYDVPISDDALFRANMPKAEKVFSFTNGVDTFDVKPEEVGYFLQNMPRVKPLHNYDLSFLDTPAPPSSSVPSQGDDFEQTLDIISAAESGQRNIPNQGGTSRAWGHYQIVPDTFEQIKKKYPELSYETWEDFQQDTDLQKRVASRLLQDIDSTLNNKKIPITRENRYYMWFSGNPNLATADGSADISSVLTPEQIRANNLQGMSVDEVRGMLNNNLKRGESFLGKKQQTTQPPQQPQQVQPPPAPITPPSDQKQPQGHVNPEGWQFTEDTRFGRELKIATKSAIASIGRTIDDIANRFKNELTGGMILDDNGKLVAPGEKGYKPSPQSDFRESLEAYEKDVPQSQGGIVAKLAGITPFIGMAAATILSRNKEMAQATTATFGAMGYGDAIKVYDEHMQQTHQQPDDQTRAGAGLLYAAAMTAPTGYILGKMMPKGLYQKALSAAFKANPEVLNYTGKQIFEAFMQKSPSLAMRYLNAVKGNALHSVGAMEVMELSKKAVEELVIGKDVSLQEWLQTATSAAESGVLFAMATTPFSMYAQGKATTQRREAQGYVTLTVDPKTGKAVEIIPMPDGSNRGLTPEGKFTDLTQEQIKMSFTMPMETFKQASEQFKSTHQVAPDFERQVFVDNITRFADNIGVIRDPGVASSGMEIPGQDKTGSEIRIFTLHDGTTLFGKNILGGEKRNGEQSFGAIDEQGNPYVVKESQVAHVQVVSKEEFIRQALEKYDQGPQQPAAPQEDPFKQLFSDPRTVHEDKARQSASDLANKDDGLVTIVREKSVNENLPGREWFVKKGHPTNMDGSMYVWDGKPNGESKMLTKKQIDGRPVEMTQEQWIKKQMIIFDQAEADKKLSEQNQMRYKGKVYTKAENGYEDEENETWLDPNQNPVNIPKKAVKEWQNRQGQPQQPTAQGIQSRVFDKTEYYGSIDETGSFSISEPMRRAEVANLIENVSKETAGKSVVVDTPVENMDPTQPMYTVKVVPWDNLTPEEQQQHKLESDLFHDPEAEKRRKEEEEKAKQPSYHFMGEEVSREEAETVINLAGKNKDKEAGKKELEALEYKNDAALDKLIEHHFPKPKPAYAKGKEKLTALEAKIRIKQAKDIQDLKEIKVENDEEIQKLWDEKARSFNPNTVDFSDQQEKKLTETPIQTVISQADTEINNKESSQNNQLYEKPSTEPEVSQVRGSGKPSEVAPQEGEVKDQGKEQPQAEVEPTVEDYQQLNEVHKNLAGQYLEKHGELVKQGLRGDNLTNHPDLVAIKEQMERIEKFFKNNQAPKPPAKQPEPEQITGDPVTLHNNLIGMVEDYNGTPSTHTNIKNEMLGRIRRIVQQLEYQLVNFSGRIEVHKDGKKITRIGQRQTTEDIQSHKALKDYPDEVRQFIEIIILNKVSALGLDIASTRAQAEQGINNILEGKKTVAANEVLDSLEKMFKDGEILIKGTRDNEAHHIPIAEFLAAIEEPLQATDVEIESLPDDYQAALWEAAQREELDQDEQKELNQIDIQDEQDNQGNQEENPAGSPAAQADRAAEKEVPGPGKELTPLQKEIASLKKERSDLEKEKQNLVKEVNARNGLFGDLHQEDGDLFGGAGFDPSAGEKRQREINQRLATIDLKIEELTQKQQQADRENEGQMEIEIPEASAQDLNPNQIFERKKIFDDKNKAFKEEETQRMKILGLPEEGRNAPIGSSGPYWKSYEEISFSPVKKGWAKTNEVSLAQAPNGQWSYGVSTDVGTSGGGYAAGHIGGKWFKTREEALIEALNKFIKYVQSDMQGQGNSAVAYANKLIKEAQAELDKLGDVAPSLQPETPVKEEAKKEKKPDNTPEPVSSVDEIYPILVAIRRNYKAQWYNAFARMTESEMINELVNQLKIDYDPKLLEILAEHYFRMPETQLMSLEKFKQWTGLNDLLREVQGLNNAAKEEASVQWVIDHAKYTPRHKNSKIVRLKIDNVLALQDPEYKVERGNENEMKGRIDSAKEFLQKKPKELEASIISFRFDGKTDFEDGRHRIVAARELGADYAYFEIKDTPEQNEAMALFMQGKPWGSLAPQTPLEQEMLNGKQQVEAKKEEAKPEAPPADDNIYTDGNWGTEIKDGTKYPEGAIIEIKERRWKKNEDVWSGGVKTTCWELGVADKYTRNGWRVDPTTFKRTDTNEGKYLTMIPKNDQVLSYRIVRTPGELLQQSIEPKQPDQPIPPTLSADELRLKELTERMRKLLPPADQVQEPEAQYGTQNGELLAIGSEMAFLHIKMGKLSFGDFARAMVKDLGPAVKPYLKSFYNGARDFPGMEEYESRMDGWNEVRKMDIEQVLNPDKIVNTPKTPQQANQDIDKNQQANLPPDQDNILGQLDKLNPTQEPLNVTKNTGLTIESISDKAFVVKGDTRSHSAELREAGGIWKGGYKGWMFPKSRQSEIEQRFGITPKAESQYPENKKAYVAAIIAKLSAKEKIVNTPALTKLAAEAGMKAGIDYKDIKELYDLASSALNQHVLSMPTFNPNKVKADKMSIKSVLYYLDELSDLLPTETQRSREQVELQQYSTPLSLAYLVNWVAQPAKGETVLEPSAGEGNLAVFARLSGARVIANEMDPKRLELLKLLGLRTTKIDAKHVHLMPVLKNERIHTVVMNPPFSRDIALGNALDLHAAEKHIESALQKLEPGGRLVAIVGRGMSLDSATHSPWWKKIANQYTIRANIALSGDAYRKKGTSFDNRMVVIDKTGATVNDPITANVENYKDLIDILQQIEPKQRINLSNENTRTNSQAEADPANGGLDGTRNRPSDVPGTSRGSDQGAGHDTPKGHGGMADAPQQPGSRELPDSRGGRSRPGGSRPGGKAPGPDNGRGNSRSSAAGGPVGRHEGTNVDKGFEPAVALQYDFVERTLVQSETLGYDTYSPEIKVPGSVVHPTPLVESTAMASVSLPKVNYHPVLSPTIIKNGALSEAQLEDNILAGASHARILPSGIRRGMYLGGGTGYGKGRVIASIILDNFNQGRKKAVWISANDKAHYDSLDYWKAVGGDPEQAFRHKNAKAGITRSEGVLLYTYGTLRSGFEPRVDYRDNENFWSEAPQSRVQQLAQWLGKDFDGVIVFDEAHFMGNAEATKGKRGTKEASQRAMAAMQLDRMLPNARVLYASATGATEVANLAYATRLGLWGDGTPFASSRNFVESISNAGLAGMEIIAKDLKTMGLYTARQISFEGVEYRTVEHKLTPEQRALYNKVADAWQVVMHNVRDAIKQTGSNAQAKSAAWSAFWGAQQRFFQQIITTMQLPTLIENMQKDLNEGKSVVVQLVSTNEAVTQRALTEARNELEEGEELDYDALDLSPKTVLLNFLERSFPVNMFEEVEDDRGNKQKRLLRDDQGNTVQDPELVAKRDALIAELSRDLALPEGPLDILINTFGAENVAEVTARTNRIIKMQNEDGVWVKAEQKRSDSHARQDKDDFMDLKKRILIFSKAGGTGASFHSDRSRKNQQQRSHYVLQVGWKADDAIQGFGRDHRSNQRIAPIFSLMTTDLKAHMRFLSSVARRLDQLGAMSKGQRQTGGQGILDGSYNLEGKYAQQALFNFYLGVEAGMYPEIDMSVLEDQMALKIYREDKQGNREYNPEVVKNTTLFLNRIMMLRIDLMDNVFEAYMEQLASEEDRARKNGTYDEGIVIVKASSTRVTDQKIIYTDPGTGAKTYLTTMELQVPNEKITWQGITARAKARSDRFLGYFEETNSERIYAMFEYSEVGADAVRRTRIMRQSVVADSNITRDDLSQKYTKINNENIAQRHWEKDFEDYPDTRKRTDYIVKGLFLPIWNRLPQNVTVRRYVDDNGTPHLGRYFTPREKENLLETFNIANTKNYTVQQAMEAMQAGGKIKLANSFELKKIKYQGLPVLQIGGIASSSGERDRMQRSGASFAVTSAMSMTGFYYLPIDVAEKGLQSIITLYNVPIVSIKDENGQEIESTEGGHIAEEPKAGYGAKAMESRSDRPKAVYQTWDEWKANQDEAESPKTLYHGTPHEVDKFTTKKIGTGEGIQAFGWGLYFTSKEDIAKDYAQKLSFKVKLPWWAKIIGKSNKNVYKVKIDDSNFMRWDKPVMPHLVVFISNAIEHHTNGKINFHDAYKRLTNRTVDVKNFNKYGTQTPKTGQEIYAILEKAYGGARNASLFLNHAGVHGIIYPANTMTGKANNKDMNYVVFDDRDVQKIEHYALEPQAPYGKPKVDEAGFFSTVETALAKIRQDKALASQWKTMLLNNGAKPAEMDWMGWDELVGMNGDQKYTREEIQGWIDQNRIEVKEVEKSQHGYEDDWDRGNDVKKDTTRYNRPDLTIPGGKNYKELLLTLPGNNIHSYTLIDVQNDRVITTSDDYEYLIDLRLGKYADKETVVVKNKEKGAEKNFTHRHWDEPNVVAHVRFNERSAQDGSRVLFLEEIQSDWGETGRKEGFKGSLKDLPEGYGIAAQNDMFYVVRMGNPNGFVGRGFTMEEAKADALARLNDRGVPDMPFKKTDQWVNLAFRRMLRYAAQNGFDRIAWTLGNMQAERYKLSKYVDSISWYYNEGETTGRIVADKDFEKVFEQDAEESKLPDIIGKEATKKLLEQKADDFSDTDTGKTIRLLRGDKYRVKRMFGEDLKIGGQGMKSFYDQIIPSAVNKLAKPFGARVEGTYLGTGINEFSFKSYAEWLKEHHPDMDAGYVSMDSDIYKEYEKQHQDISTVQSIAITPQMRLSFQEGMPLFEPEAFYGKEQEMPVMEQEMESQQEQPANEIPTSGVRGKVYKLLDQMMQQYFPGDEINMEDFNYWFEKYRNISSSPRYEVRGDHAQSLALDMMQLYMEEKTQQRLQGKKATKNNQLRTYSYGKTFTTQGKETQDLPDEASESAGSDARPDDLRGQGDSPNSQYNVKPPLLTDLMAKARQDIEKKKKQVDEDLDDILGPQGSVDEVQDPGAPYNPNNTPPLLTDHMRNVMVRYMPSKREKRTMAQVWEGMREAMQDDELPVRRLEEEIINRGGKIGDNQQPYRKLALSKGRLETLHVNFINRQMTPVLEAIAEIGKTGLPKELVLPYIICKHAPERNAYLRAKEYNTWYEKHKYDYLKWFAAHPDSTLAEQDDIWEKLEQAVEDKWDLLQKKDYSGIMPMDINFEFAGDPDGFATTIATEIENALAPELVDNLWDAIRNVSLQTIEYWEAGRQISQETAQEYRNRYEYFVPLRGWRDGDAESLAYTRGEGFSRSLQHAEGRRSLADNPLAYMQKVAFGAINEMVDFEVKQELFRLVSMNYKGFENMYRIKKAYYVRDVNPVTGEETWELCIDPVTKEMVKPEDELFESGDATTVMYRQHMNYRAPQEARDKEVLIHRDLEDGGDVVIVMLPPWENVARAMNHRNSMYHLMFSPKLRDAKDWDNIAINSVAYLNNAWKANMTSRNVVFAFTNFLRDAQEAPITAFIKGENPFKLMPHILKSFPAALRGITGNLDMGQAQDRYYEEFSLMGGITGYSHMKSIPQIEEDLTKQLKRISRRSTVPGKSMNTLAASVHALEVWSNTFETATRLGVYSRAREMGKTPSEAAMDAKEYTLNFNRGGKLKKPMDAAYAFVGVQIESMHKNGSLFKRFTKGSLKAAGIYFFLGLLEAMLNDWTKPETEDGEYYNLSEYVRQNYLIIPDLVHLATKGRKGDKYLRLPLPPFWRGFKSLGTITYDVIQGKSTIAHGAGRAITNFLWASLSPIDLGNMFMEGKINISPVVPTIARPFAEIMENRNYMGYRISKEPFTRSQEKALADAHLHVKDVNRFVKFLTDALFRAGGGDNETQYYVTKNKLGQVERKRVKERYDWNPSNIEHIIVGYLGGTAKVGIDAVSTIVQFLSPSEEINFKNVPFVNAFIRKTPTHGMKIMSEYYKLKDEIDGNDQLQQSYYKKKDFKHFVMLKGDAYLNEYTAIIESKDEALQNLMKAMDFQDAEGSEKVIELMEQTIKDIKAIKEKYQRK